MGGGFCKWHGPYDPPHTTCPFCAQEKAQRREFGPPPNSVPEFTRRSASSTPDQDVPEQDSPDDPEVAPDELAFVRTTIEPVEADPLDVEHGEAGPHEDNLLGAHPAKDAADHDAAPAPESPPPTKDDITQIAPSQIVSENIVEEPSWIEPQPEPLGWLIVTWPLEQRGEVLLVRANQTIGRQGDIRWNDVRLSRQHARLTFEPTVDGELAFHLWPFGPTNPVIVNDEMIRGATPIYENDEIHLGDTLFIFKVLLD